MAVVGVAVFLLVSSPGVLVIEARTQGQEPSRAIGDALEKAVGASPASNVGAQVSQRLPPVPAGTAKTEPVIEADKLVQRGRDFYLEGRFIDASNDLARARDVLSRAIESVDDERQAAEALFRAYMYLAFALHNQGRNYVPQAVEALKDAIRTFPAMEPSHSEYGPENIKLYRRVRTEMDAGPMGRLRVEAGSESAGVYLNGRLVGVTPLDLAHVYPGRYRLHARRGNGPSRIHDVDIRGGDNTVRIDVDLDQALSTERELALVYARAGQRRSQYRKHVAELVKLVNASGAFVYWNDGGRVHLAFVDAEGNARAVDTSVDEAARIASQLRAGGVGQLVEDEGERPRRIWTWVAGGIAIGALAGGIVLGLSASSDFDTLNTRYPDHMVDGAGADLRDTAGIKQTAGNIMIDVALVSAVSAAFLYWYEGRPTAPERAQVVPAIGPSFAGAQFRVGF